MHPANLNEANLTKWARSGQLRPKMDTDEACLQCHKAIGPNISAHTHHDATSSGSRCYNCHMPNNTFGLLHAMRGHQVSWPTVQESIEHGRPNACNLCHLNQTLAWTGEKLHAWYNQTVPPLSQDDQTIAAAVQWMVKGDAGQRALIAWGMGWEPAQKTAGRDWLYPYLIYSMTDPYAAIRFEAWKSLQTLPGFSDFSFTYTSDDRSLNEAAGRALTKWFHEVRGPNAVFPPETAVDSDGRFQENVFRRLRSERDDKPILLAE